MEVERPNKLSIKLDATCIDTIELLEKVHEKQFSNNEQLNRAPLPF